MTLTFLGTRGSIDIRTRRHRRHTSTLVSYRSARIMIDCGEDWLAAVRNVRPGAIVLTHGHPDHIGGLRRGAPCAVYATRDVWRHIESWPLPERQLMSRRKPRAIAGVVFEAVPVVHSIRAPAVGYRITAGRTTIFYVPDVLELRDRSTLADIALYVGDGASIDRPIVRGRGRLAVGHTSIAEQLRWCADANVPRAVFTHCGTQIVANGKSIEERISAMGAAQGVRTHVATDGEELNVRHTWR